MNNRLMAALALSPLLNAPARPYCAGLCWVGLLECYYDFVNLDALFMNKSP